MSLIRERDVGKRRNPSERTLVEYEGTLNVCLGDEDTKELKDSYRISVLTCVELLSLIGKGGTHVSRIFLRVVYHPWNSQFIYIDLFNGRDKGI